MEGQTMVEFSCDGQLLMGSKYPPPPLWSNDDMEDPAVMQQTINNCFMTQSFGTVSRVEDPSITT